MLARGQTIDKYVIDGVLGDGGMAVVYKVRHKTLGSLHALKVLTHDGERTRQRLIAEGRAQGQLQHPNLLNVTDIVDVGGAPGLVMEYVEHGTMEEWLDRVRPDREDRVAAFRQVVDCVAAAHALGWIHRDLKPDNILMDRVGDQWVPKVADFGLVKALDAPLGKARTKMGVAMGTPGFMAAEQFLDAGAVTPAADVFSLGCILIWLITEVEPFAGDTPLAVYKNVAASTHVALKPSDPLADLTNRCLSLDPLLRPQTAGDLLAELGPGDKPRVDFGQMAARPPASRPRRSKKKRPSSRSRSMLNSGLPLSCGALMALLLAAMVVLPVCGMAGWIYLSRTDAKVCNIQGTSGSMGELKGPHPVGWSVLKRPVRVFLDGVYRCKLPAGTRVRVSEVRGTGDSERSVLLYDAGTALPRWPALRRTLVGSPNN